MQKHGCIGAPAVLAVLIAIGIATATSLSPDLAPALVRAASAPGPNNGQELNLLFIQQASSGRLIMDTNSSTNGSLILTGVGRHTVWFSDRPARTAGQVETAYLAGSKFMDSEGDWLSKPNAALYASNPGPNPNNDTIIIVTLTAPVYNASVGTITYRVDIVPATTTLAAEGPKASSLLKSYVQTAADPNTPILISDVVVPVMEFDNVVLFIDDWCSWFLGLGLGLLVG